MLRRASPSVVVALLFACIVGASVTSAGSPAAGLPPDADCDGVVDRLDAFAAPGACQDPRALAAGPVAIRARWILAARAGEAATLARASELAMLAGATAGRLSDASGGGLSLLMDGAPTVLVLDESEGDVAALATGLARAYFARPDAGEPELLIVVPMGFSLAAPSCGCVSWHQRARADGPLGERFDSTAAFGAPSSFRGVVALRALDQVPADRLATLAVHEIAHTWCCQLSAQAPPEARELVDGRGHWVARANAALAADPLAVDGHAHASARFATVTLAAMGILAPRDAGSLTLSDGRSLSAWDLLAAPTS